MQVKFEYKPSKLNLIGENKVEFIERCGTALTSTHAGVRKLRPHFRAAFAAGRADEVGLDAGQPDIIGPAVSVGLDMVATPVITAIDQHVTNAGLAHLAEGYFLGAGRHFRLLRCHRASSGLLKRALSCYNLQGGNARGA